MERARHATELTDRQRQVLRMLERGHTNSEIAAALGISLQGAKWHVRELLGKFGADSREELIERSSAERGLGARLGRWMSGVAALGVPKASTAAVLGGAVVAASVGVSAAAFALRGSGHDVVAPPVAAAASPTPIVFVPAVAGLTPAAMPAARGAIWTPAEALDNARRSAGPELSSHEQNLAESINLDTFTVTLLEWLPGIARFELDGGDMYWDSEDGLARDVWHVRWQKNAFPTEGNLQSYAPYVDLTVDFLIEDGKTIYGMLAYRMEGTVSGTGGPVGIGGANGFRSRGQDERYRLFTTATGPETVVAWLNNVPGTESFSIWPTAAGVWCQTASAEGGYGCGFDPARTYAPITYGYSRNYDRVSGQLWSRLKVETEARVVAIRVITAEGAVYDFETNAPPPELPQQTRFAYLDVGPIDCAPLVIGYDAAGQEVARRNHSGSLPPPGAC